MNAQVEKYMAPVQELNALAVANVEKILNLQLKRIEETAKVSIEQLKAVASIKDVEGFQGYVTSYAESLRQLGERTAEDFRTVYELGNSYTTQAQRIFKDALKTN
ncbi:MAG: phasin family protein [Gammaproteobacteria bacterium]|nr:phasin family protein [Gammaproteobacteria bacterium]